MEQRIGAGLKNVISSASVAGLLLVTSCGAHDEAGEQDLSTQVESREEGFKNSLSFSGCGTSQIEKIRRAANILSDRIYENQGASFRACLADAFLSHMHEGQWSSDIWMYFNRNAVTQFTCVSNMSTECADTTDWWGCASVGISGESMKLANQAVNDPNVSDAELAGVIAHELAHNYGHTHNVPGDGEYEFTVPQQVRRCVSGGNRLALGFSRTSGIPLENELGPVGRMGGTRTFEKDCPYQDFIRGFRVSSVSRVDGLSLLCQDGTETIFYGGEPVPRATRDCGPDQVVVGVTGRAGATLDRMSVVCAPRSNLTATRTLASSGGTGGQPFERLCPPGKAVRRVRGRVGTEIDQLQLICDDVNGSGPPGSALASWRSSWLRGTQTGMPAALRCAGGGALTSLVGRAGARIDRLSGMCNSKSSARYTPYVAGGAAHPMVPFVGGGSGGQPFTMSCPAGEAMVGFRVRSGSSIDGLSPVCAETTRWSRFADNDHDMAEFVGGSGGTLTRFRCPNYHFLVGFDTWSDSRVNGIMPTCRRML